MVEVEGNARKTKRENGDEKDKLIRPNSRYSETIPLTMVLRGIEDGRYKVTARLAKLVCQAIWYQIGDPAIPICLNENDIKVGKATKTISRQLKVENYIVTEKTWKDLALRFAKDLLFWSNLDRETTKVYRGKFTKDCCFF